MTSLFTESQHRILKDIKLEFLKMNAADDEFAVLKEASMVPLSEEVYASLPEYEDHPSEYYDKLLNEQT